MSTLETAYRLFDDGMDKIANDVLDSMIDELEECCDSTPISEDDAALLERVQDALETFEMERERRNSK